MTVLVGHRPVKPTAWHWCPEPEAENPARWMWALRACDVAMTRLRAQVEADRALALCRAHGVPVPPVPGK